MIMNKTDKKTLFWNCDEPDVRQRLTNATSTLLGAEMAGADLVLIDEAQRVQNIGLTLKLMVDNFPEKQMIQALALFWRTQQQQEIDYLEDIDGTLHTYEFKWSGTKHPKLSETFAKNYPDHTYTVVNPDNYMEFILGKI